MADTKEGNDGSVQCQRNATLNRPTTVKLIRTVHTSAALATHITVILSLLVIAAMLEVYDAAAV